VKLIGELWSSLVESLVGLGSVVRFLLRLVAESPRALLRLDLTAQQVYNSGALSLVIIMLSGLFVGMVLGLQGFELLQRFGSEEALGTAPDGEPHMRELERKVVLSVLDRKWREHLYEMDYLQEGIQLRSYGQRDPLVEYQREGFTMFATMMDAIKEESVQLLFNLEVQVAVEPAPDADALTETPSPDADVPARKTIAQKVAATENGGQAVPHLVAPGLRAARRPARLEYSAPTIDGDTNTALPAGLGAAAAAAVAAAVASNDAPLMYAGTPRNAKCPCGSGRTYKRCHGDPRSGV